MVRLLSAAQLDGAFAGGAGVSTTSPLLDMFSYRSTVAATVATIAEDDSKDDAGGVTVENGDSTSATFFDLDDVSSDALLDSSTVVDIKVATLGANIFGHSLKGSAGTARARDSNGGPNSPGEARPMQLRSKPTVVEVSLQDATSPLEVSGLAARPVLVTLPVVPGFSFNTSADAYRRVKACPPGQDMTPIGLECPLDPTTTHVCDHERYAEGGDSYFFEYDCPRIVPTCLSWDEGAGDFSNSGDGFGCVVEEGYSETEVTCSCSSLATPIALGSNTSAPRLVTIVTPGPTAAPTPLPSTSFPSQLPTPYPSHIPTEVPTLSLAPTPGTPDPTSEPTNKPTDEPTAEPTDGPTFKPTDAPVIAPTLLPTDPAQAEVGEIQVKLAMEVSADEAPTSDEVFALKEVVTAQIGLASNSDFEIKDFTVTVFAEDGSLVDTISGRRNRRRLSHRRRRLTAESFTWEVSFTVDVLGGSLTFADIADTLKDDSFAEAVAEDSRLDITVTVLAVSGSDEPVGDDGNPVDVVEPKEEDEEETKKKGGNTDAASSGVIIGVAAGGAVLAIVLGFVAYRCGLCGFSGKKAANMGEDANEPTVEMQKIFPDRSTLPNVEPEHNFPSTGTSLDGFASIDLDPTNRGTSVDLDPTDLNTVEEAKGEDHRHIAF